MACSRASRLRQRPVPAAVEREAIDVVAGEADANRAGRLHRLGVAIGHRAHRLEEAVATGAVAPVVLDERLVDESPHDLGDVELVELRIAEGRLDLIEPEAVHEDAERVEHGLLDGVEELVAPVEEPLQRPLAIGEERGVAGRRPPAADASEEVGGRQDAAACGRQLDRQRKSVEVGTELGDHRSVRVVEDGRRVASTGAIDEQLDGSVSVHERLQRVHLLGAHAQALAAGGQDPRRRTRRRDPRDQLASGREHVLAVVEDHEDLVVAEVVDDRVEGIVDTSQSQRLAHHAPDRLAGRHRREVHHPRPAGPAWCDRQSELDGEAGLADATRSADGDHLAGGHQRAERSELVAAADDGIARLRQVVTVCGHRAQRREPPSPGSSIEVSSNSSIGSSKSRIR